VRSWDSPHTAAGNPACNRTSASSGLQHHRSINPKTKPTVARVAALGLGLGGQARARPRVDVLRLPDHQAVLDQLADVLPCEMEGLWGDQG
jgi:hypothetical protein